MKKTTIIILVCTAMVLGILFGIIVNILDDSKIEEAQLNEIKKLNELIDNNQLVNLTGQNQIIATNNSDVKLSPNAMIYFEKHYKDCGHTIIQKEKINVNEVNKDEEYFKNAYSDWEIKEFSSDEVKLYRELSGTCDEHYLITIQDDKIVVFNIDEDGNTILKEETDIPITYLTEQDIQLLEQGIRANGESELSKKLEDFE